MGSESCESCEWSDGGGEDPERGVCEVEEEGVWEVLVGMLSSISPTTAFLNMSTHLECNKWDIIIILPLILS